MAYGLPHDDELVALVRHLIDSAEQADEYVDERATPSVPHLRLVWVNPDPRRANS